ncbi:uncharacterized protein LOC111895314 [Lactuca sativa]|uniref:uncharacterized protein LOC111895314 n=1 Tax=Lactuca sativa TaxID=4236 RepID=UPI000CD824D3|nr:uncharacterized protein LOC111895314 [Lactuca sativa]
MPPRRNMRHVNINATPAPPPLPPPQFDATMFLATVTATVATTISHINTTIASGSGSSAPSSNQGESYGHHRECTYKYFSNAKPWTFNGTVGVMELRQWIEKIEAVFEICSSLEGRKIKFATCNFADRALTWWNGHVKSLTLVVANSVSWENFKSMLMREYCPQGEIQKLEQELWGLTMVGSDITTYINRFCDLAILSQEMVALESKKIESAKKLAQSLINHGVHQNTVAAAPEQPKNNNNSKKKSWSKRKGQFSQEPSKKQQLVAVHAATVPAAIPANPKPAKPDAGKLPKCNKCNFHHNRNCLEMQCRNCNKKGHTARFCKSPPQAINQAPADGVGQACYGCGEVGHFKIDCRKAGNVVGVGRILSIGYKEAVADPTVVTVTFLLNITYACILFDCGG